MRPNDGVYCAGIGVSRVVVVDEDELLVGILLTVADVERKVVPTEFVAPVGDGFVVAPDIGVLCRDEFVRPIRILIGSARDLPSIVGGLPRQPLVDTLQVFREYARFDFGCRIEGDVFGYLAIVSPIRVRFLVLDSGGIIPGIEVLNVGIGGCVVEDDTRLVEDPDVHQSVGVTMGLPELSLRPAVCLGCLAELVEWDRVTVLKIEISASLPQ
ncbi:hypothetical protein [Salinigranum halophilum]|uniref:hypothetical protein n=1 Tax=Salinigranum halophilum TaxID=2565931 RepID=UPI001375DFF9|nr:hypothetical protein [Salinigranum halophilum]